MVATIKRSMRPTQILMVAGLLVWALCGVDVFRAASSGSGPFYWMPIPFWLLFIAAFLAEAVFPSRVNFRAALAVQTASALVVIAAAGGDGIAGALLVMIAGQLPAVFPMRLCLVWVVAQTALAFLPTAGRGKPLMVGVGALAYIGFQLFAVGAAGLAESERRARTELFEAKARLETLQERLEETTREAERLRIARDLHDSLGHHLTALGLDLELARHLARGEAAPPIERARALASSLMAELREAVTELRADAGIDLIARLRSLARDHGRPRVEVEVADGVCDLPAGVALALSRVAQEVVTNTTRHANADNLRLSFRESATEWTFQARDDGLGVDVLLPGHGVSGMKERVEGIGGLLHIDTAAGRGFIVTATIPRPDRS